MGAWLVSLILMAIAGRELSREISVFQTLFFRSFICLALVLPVLAAQGWHLAASRLWRLHILRNVMHYGAQYGWFFGIAFIPLAEVFAIEFTAPIWTAILAALFLRERLTPLRIGAIALAFSGIVVMLRPGLAIVDTAALVVLASAVGFGATYVITKRLTRNERPVTILFYMHFIQLLLGVVPAAWVWVWPSPELWPWVAAVGLSGLASHYCLARAVALADASVVAPMDFIRLPLIAIIGFMFYDEPVDVFVFIGALLVLSGNLANIRGAQREEGRPR